MKYITFVPFFGEMTTKLMEIEEKKLKILEGAGKLILKYGVKSMTMDDISRELGISKKTLYQYVEDKNDLIKQIMQMDVEVDHGKICHIIERNLNAIEESFEIFKSILENMGDVPPNILYDLKKYHPEAYALHKDFMWAFSKNCLEENLSKGIKEGYYREDLNITVVAIGFILMMINVCENPEPWKGLHPVDVYKEIFQYHIHAVASNKGKKYLTEKYSSMNF